MAHLHNIYDSDIHFKLDSKTRTFSNETELKLLVAQGDHNSERFTFEIPRYIEQHDMLKCNRIEIHYINISSTTRDASKDVYIVDDAQVSPEDENVVEFSWLLSGRATQYNGTLSFAISMKCLTDEVIDYRWNTLTYDKILVGKSLNNAETIAQEYSDVLEKWKKEVLENINPTVTIDTELNEESDNAIANSTVAKKISQLSDEIANVGNPTDEQVSSAINSYIEANGISAGLTKNQINALDNMFKVCAYTQSDVSTQYNAFKTAFGITDSGNEEPDTPTVTLTSISATYSGGEVLVGTDIDDLTGITVTGTYSDGTTKNIVDYALSGTINEGTNTITVSYEGKTTTFTVTGYVEKVEDDSITPPCTLPTDNIVGGFIGNNGVVTERANSYIANTYIRVTPSESYNVDATNIFELDTPTGYKLNTPIRYAWYDSTKTFISRSNDTFTTAKQSIQITAPSNAHYIIIAIESDGFVDDESVKNIFDKITFEEV